jgi:hypothetical protein
MSFGPGGKAVTVDITSGATVVASAVNLDHAWERVYLEIPSLSSGGTHYVRAGQTSDGSFYRVHMVDPADGGDNVWQVGAPANGAIFPVPAGFQYYKVENSSGVTDATTTYKFHFS